MFVYGTCGLYGFPGSSAKPLG